MLLAGLVLLTLGLLFFTRVSPHGSYLGDLAPGFILAGVGLGFAFIPVTIAALMGISDDEAGLASGLINTSQQIGGAFGVALLATVFTSRTADQIHAGVAQDIAYTDGLSRAFLVGALMSVLGARRRARADPRQRQAEAGAEVPVTSRTRSRSSAQRRGDARRVRLPRASSSASGRVLSTSAAVARPRRAVCTASSMLSRPRIECASVEQTIAHPGLDDEPARARPRGRAGWRGR